MDPTSMVRLEFGTPFDSTPSAVDAKRITFPFRVVETGRGALRDTATEHRISVSISGTLMAMWGFGRMHADDPNLLKTLFEVARREAFERLVEGTLSEHQEVRLMTNTAPDRSPFDPHKIPSPEGWTSQELDLEALREDRRTRAREERKIGFQLSSVVETTVGDGGTVVIHDLPFQPGEEVEVSVRPRTPAAERDEKHSLRNTVIRYGDPFGSVAEDDWEALK